MSNGRGDFRGRVLLAPLAGVTDATFRTLCAECGAELTFTEMISSKALSCASEKTHALLDISPDEQRIGVQLFGHEPETMAAQAAYVSECLGGQLAARGGGRLVCIDLNMGCPVRKIAGKGDGAALMKDPRLAARIVEACVRATPVPITVKFRRGWLGGVETAPEFARALESAGAQALTVHGRFAEQLYAGKADWDCIARVCAAVNIPVAGNGDVQNGHDAVALFEHTGCDSVMVGRAALGNPWIFAEINAALRGETWMAPTIEERLGLLRRHLRMFTQANKSNIVRMRKQACWYVAGLPGAARAREAFNRATTLADFEQVIDEWERYVTTTL